MQKFKTSVKQYLCSTVHSYRCKSGLTQDQMARILRMTSRSYGSLERGISGCSATTLLLFLSKLNDEEILQVIRELTSRLSSDETD